MEDAVSSVLHTSLVHLEEEKSYVRLLFVDFSSAFNTIVPQHLVDKLGSLGFSAPLCNWLLGFLTERSQRVGSNISSSIPLSVGSPQGCVLSPACLEFERSSVTLPTHIVAFVTLWEEVPLYSM